MHAGMGRHASRGASRTAGPGAGFVLPSRSQTTRRGPCPLVCQAPTPCLPCFLPRRCVNTVGGGHQPSPRVGTRTSPLGPRAPHALAPWPAGSPLATLCRREGGIRLLCSPSSEPCCWPLSSPTDGPPDVRVRAGDRARPLHWPPGIPAHGFPEGACWPLAAPATVGRMSWC